MGRTYLRTVVVALLCSSTSASLAARQTAAAPDPTAISLCSVRSSTQFCSAGTTEFRVVSTPTSSLPSSYTGCHKHGSDLFCFYPGGEVEITQAVAAATATAAPATTTSAAAAVTGAPTAVSDCHQHGSSVFCMWGTTEYQVMITATATQDIPPTFTSCHAHGSDTYCLGPGGADVEIRAEGAADEHASEGDASGTNQHCHFHAGVEHCTGGSESEESSGSSCEKITRDYNIPLRVGLLFVILVTSAIGVFAPIFLIRWWPTQSHTTFLVLKQFGTGVIISTAFIHLYTHAQLMFGNSCLGELEFEGTTSALVMAGIFLSFLVEFIGKRIVLARMSSSPDRVSRLSPATVTVLVLEAGIIFHSILIGITLVVAGDSFFLTLFVVILFHQMFEGIALGTRIAGLGTPTPIEESQPTTATAAATQPKEANGAAPDNNSTSDVDSPAPTQVPETKAPYFSLGRKLLLALPFALVTPIGMAIGIGVLQQFNGNNRSTILAIGTLDAVSAGILVWVGVVEMWAEDWMIGGAELLNTSVGTTLLAGFGLVSGMVIMSVLGKWA